MNRPLPAAVLIGLACLPGCASGDRAEEVEVALADLPPAVRTTLDRESRGGTVTEIDRERENGRTIYSADVMMNGQEWEVEIGEDGTLLSKEMERDDDDDDNGDDDRNDD